MFFCIKGNNLVNIIKIKHTYLKNIPNNPFIITIITISIVNNNKLYINNKSFSIIVTYIQHTVTFVKTSYGNIVGGYTSISWKGNTKQRDLSAFIFNILNKHIFTPYTNTYSIYPNDNTFPSFGEDRHFGNDDGNIYTGRDISNPSMNYAIKFENSLLSNKLKLEKRNI